MKTTNLKKSMADIRFIKAQFDQLFESDSSIGKFMHSLLCDMSEQSISPDDFFAGFCYAAFEHHNKHNEVRCKDTNIIPNEPCGHCPLRASGSSEAYICPSCPLHDPDIPYKTCPIRNPGHVKMCPSCPLHDSDEQREIIDQAMMRTRSRWEAEDKS